MRRLERTLILGAISACILLAGCKTTSSDSGGDDDETTSPAKQEATGQASMSTTPSTTAGMATVDASGGKIDVPDFPKVEIRGDGDAWVPESGDFILRDVETGSIWNLSGRAIAGPLAGEKLEQLPAFNSFWFAWSAFYDGSEIWNRDVDNTPGSLTKGDECLVDCDEVVMGCPSKDCIPALDHDAPDAPMVAAGDDGAAYLDDDDFVLGVEIDGEARAYPHNILWWHEIYNDQVNGRDYTVSFCPLTGSGLIFEGQFNGTPTGFGVSGKLYNSNLVMYDDATDSNWSQMLRLAVTGPEMGTELDLLPVVETTWGRWKQMHPDTKVISDKTGHSRDYERYPYGDYRTNHGDTFGATNPDFQDTYQAKDRVLGLVGEQTSRAYAFPEIEENGDRVVINDTLDSERIVIVYEAEHRLAVPFYANIDGQQLTFEGATAP